MKSKYFTDSELIARVPKKILSELYQILHEREQKEKALEEILKKEFPGIELSVTEEFLLLQPERAGAKKSDPRVKYAKKKSREAEKIRKVLNTKLQKLLLLPEQTYLPSECRVEDVTVTYQTGSTFVPRVLMMGGSSPGTTVYRTDVHTDITVSCEEFPHLTHLTFLGAANLEKGDEINSYLSRGAEISKILKNNPLSREEGQRFLMLTPGDKEITDKIEKIKDREVVSTFQYTN